MKIDSEMIGGTRAMLRLTDLREWCAGPVVLSGGMIMICRRGHTTMRINFCDYQLTEGTVMTLFPNDVVSVSSSDDDFLVEVLGYDAALLREACLQLEQTVYTRLRDNRSRTDSPTVTAIIDTMFRMVRLYFEQEDCGCTEQIVLLQLKAFFVGFHDYVSRSPSADDEVTGSRRRRELFSRFMGLVEMHYKEYRDIASYAAIMNITPKYLNNIVQSVTAHTAKTVIDHFVVLQLKAALRTSGRSVKEVAWDFHFSDQSFFCRYFKRHTGFTPQSFRKAGVTDINTTPTDASD